MLSSSTLKHSGIQKDGKDRSGVSLELAKSGAHSNFIWSVHQILGNSDKPSRSAMRLQAFKWMLRRMQALN